MFILKSVLILVVPCYTISVVPKLSSGATVEIQKVYLAPYTLLHLKINSALLSGKDGPAYLRLGDSS
jgi:hypothetical protein